MSAFIRLVAGLAFASALVWTFGFLYLKTQASGPGERETVDGRLRELKQADADWNVNVLRSKSGLNNNYDAFVPPQRIALQVQEELAGLKKEASDSRIRDAETKLRESLAAKIELVDHFKAQNAILRNSMRFIPHATAELKKAAREAGDAVAAARPQMVQLSEAADQALVDTLKLESAGDSTTIIRLREQLRAMVEHRASYPAAVGESFDVFANHVITILAQKEREEEVLERLGKLAVAERIDAFSKALDNAFAQADAERDSYRMMMYGIGAFMLAMLTLLFWRSNKRRPAAA